MMQALEILLLHDRWATDRLLEACLPLSNAQLDQPFQVGTGSLRRTIIHMIEVIAGWQAALAETPEPADLEASLSVDALMKQHAEVADSFWQFVDPESPPRTQTAARGNQRMTVPRDAIAVHILTHGMHHRAQALNMLRHIGVTPLPQSSVLQWMMATGVAKMETIGP